MSLLKDVKMNKMCVNIPDSHLSGFLSEFVTGPCTKKNTMVWSNTGLVTTLAVSSDVVIFKHVVHVCLQCFDTVG